MTYQFMNYLHVLSGAKSFNPSPHSIRVSLKLQGVSFQIFLRQESSRLLANKLTFHCAFNRHHDRFGVNHRRIASKIPTFAGIFHQSQSLYVQIETKQRCSQGHEDDGEAKKSRAKKHSNDENFI